MAELLEINTWPESTAYLTDLRHTVANDIRPLLGTPGSAPFAVFREVMSYIDHLGHLYSGREPVGERFLSFARMILCAVDPNYGRRAQEIYQMYRNGPVHEFKPKILENDGGEVLAWFSYRGPRSAHSVPQAQIVVTHLEPVPRPGQARFHWLPVSLDCLVEDLENAIDAFIRAPDHAERVTAWNRTARRLHPPHPCNFTL